MSRSTADGPTGTAFVDLALAVQVLELHIHCLPTAPVLTSRLAAHIAKNTLPPTKTSSMMNESPSDDFERHPP
jgi:hypothetical protein